MDFVGARRVESLPPQSQRTTSLPELRGHNPISTFHCSLSTAHCPLRTSGSPLSTLHSPLLALTLSIVVLLFAAADWPQWGGSPARSSTPEGKNIPSEWNVGQFEPKSGRWLSDSAKNIRWVARLGSTTYGTPVIADGKVFCATNNGAGWLRRYPPQIDLGCLLCFRQSDGRFNWQLSREKLAAGRALDYPDQGICCAPLVEGKRLWVVTNRCEVVCLDTEGFYDGKNDGPYVSEPNTHRDEADIVWVFDMIKELGVRPRNMSACSVTAAGDLLLVNTANGVDETQKRLLAPQAPSFIAMEKHTGKLVWADSSPNGNILDGQWSSPATAVLGGVPQAIFAGGDGWLYSFRTAAQCQRQARVALEVRLQSQNVGLEERRLRRPQ